MHDEHGVHDVVVVELAPLPDPLLHDGLVDVPVLVGDKLSLTRLVVVHGQVCTHEELALEQLDPDDGEHELEEEGDEDDVADSLDGHDDALDDVLEALGTVDGSKGAKDTQHTKNLHHRDSTGTAKQ